MLPRKYRLTLPTLAMFREEGAYVTRAVPEGTVITVIDKKPFDGERLMEVEWEGKRVLMFTQALRESAEQWDGD